MRSSQVNTSPDPHPHLVGYVKGALVTLLTRCMVIVESSTPIMKDFYPQFTKSLPFWFICPCGKSPWAQCHVLTLLTHAHTHSFSHLPNSASSAFPFALSSPKPASYCPPIYFSLHSSPVLISERGVEDGEARPSQKTFHYLFSSHLPHWEQRRRAAVKSAEATESWKKKQLLNKMGLKP